MKRILATLLLFALLLYGCQSTELETEPTTQPVTEPSYEGLIFETPTNMTLEVCAESPENVPLTPEKTEQTGEMLRYYYPNASGAYFYTVSGVNCYTAVRSLYVAPQDQGKELVVTVEPEQVAGNGWEATKYHTYSDEIMAYKPDDPALWPEYPEAFASPVFNEGRAAHQYTTQQELEAYIGELDQPDDRMYVFSAGSSASGHDVPLVIFTTTDLSGVSTLEEAAALLNENGKLTIQYQGHVHGNEPAGGEAALGMLKRLDGEPGRALLEKINVYVIPRVNPDGAQKNIRKTGANVNDPNRDLFALQEIEVRNVVRAAQLLNPTVVIDSHEYSASTTKKEDSYADVQISPGFVADDQEELAKLSVDIVQNVFTDLQQQDLSYKYYLNTLNSENVTTFRDYFCRQGKLTFVLETKGINYGNVTIGRRIVGHMVSAWSIMTQVAENPRLYLDAAARWEEQTVQNGLTFEEEDVVILQRTKSDHPEYDLTVEYFKMNIGECYSKTIPTTINDVIVRSRVAPTAYVIPAGEDWTEDVLVLMDLHGISYTFMPAGTRLSLRQYTGTTEQAELENEQIVSFSKGAYVFSMSQKQAVILSLLMEPDVTDMEGNTLAQLGMIPDKDGVFPIYRYVKTLKPDGTL